MMRKKGDEVIQKGQVRSFARSRTTVLTHCVDFCPMLTLGSSDLVKLLLRQCHMLNNFFVLRYIIYIGFEKIVIFSAKLLLLFFFNGVLHKWREVLWGVGQWFCNDSTKALVQKGVITWCVKNCVMSFVDNSYTIQDFFLRMKNELISPLCHSRRSPAKITTSRRSSPRRPVKASTCRPKRLRGTKLRRSPKPFSRSSSALNNNSIHCVR